MNDAPQPPGSRPVGDVIARNVFFLSVGQVLSTALGFVLTVVLGRSLTPTDFGLYYSILTLSTLLGILVDWGQWMVVLREVARGRADEPAFLSSALLLRLLNLVPAAALAVIVAIVFNYPHDVLILTPAVLLCGAPGVVAALFGYFLRGRDRTDLDVYAGLICRAVGVVATIVALLLGGGVAAAVLVPACGHLASLIFYWRYVRRLGLKLGVPAYATTREIVILGAPIMLVQISLSIQSLIDLSLLTGLTETQVVGWFGASRVILGFLIVPATIMAAASFPELCRVAESKTALTEVLAHSARPLLALSALAASGVYVFAPTAVSIIYGHGRFDPAATILQFTAPFVPLFFMNFLLGNAASAVGRNNEVAIAKLVCLTIYTGMCWYAVRYFQTANGNGAIGLIISFGITELLMAATFAYLLPRGVAAGAAVGSLVIRAYAVAAVAAACSFAWLPQAPLWLVIPAYSAGFLGSSMAVGLLLRTDIATGLQMAKSVARKCVRLAN